MNLRQAQRSLSELISKCEAAHVELPENPLEARAEAVESIIHSLKDGRPNLKDAQEELQQKFGIQGESRQHLETGEPKRMRRRQSSQKSVTIHQTKDVKLTQGANGDSAQYQSSSTSSDSRTVTRTRSKQQALREESSSQETATVQVAKKTESSRDVIVHEASGDTEEKVPSASSEKIILDNNGESVLPGSPDQEMIDLLDDLDEENEDEDDEGDSDTSSDEEEEHGKAHHPNSI